MGKSPLGDTDSRPGYALTLKPLSWSLSEIHKPKGAIVKGEWTTDMQLFRFQELTTESDLVVFRGDVRPLSALELLAYVVAPEDVVD